MADLPDSKCGISCTVPAMTWDEGLPLGNGHLGALVWGNGRPLRISLARTDLWDLRPIPEFHSPEYTYRTLCQWQREGRHEDLECLYRDPYFRPGPTRLPAGRIEFLFREGIFRETFLDIAAAKAEVHFQNGAHVESVVHAVHPVGMVRIRAKGNCSVQLVAPDFAGNLSDSTGDGKNRHDHGDLKALGYPRATEYREKDWMGFEQRGVGDFSYAVCLEWVEDGPSWEMAWSVASHFEGKECLRIARDRVRKALAAGFEKMFVSHREWWQSYWKKSCLRLPNKKIERQWFLDQYKFGSASRRGAPPISLQGPWVADDGKLPPWKSDYHHDLNTQLSYWPCYGGNHLEEGLAFLDWLWDTKPNGEAWTKRFYGLPGLNVPGVTDLNGNPMGGGYQWSHSGTTAAWLAQHFYLHWRYSLDRDFLAERAWPYLREAAAFIEAITEKGADGKRVLPLSFSPEIKDERFESLPSLTTNYDLALMRWLLGAAAELADEMKLREDANHWRTVLAEMPQIARADDGGSLLIAKDFPLCDNHTDNTASHRHFSHLMAIHPLGLIRYENGPQDRQTIHASLAELDRLGTGAWAGYSFAWLISLAARARDGEKAARAAEIFATAFCLPNSFHCNGDQSGKGYSRYTYRPFTLEGNFACAAGIQEMLLQSYSGAITVFPAIPDDWAEVSFDTLRAEGAFLVSAKREGGRTRSVTIVSEKGGIARLVDPFDGAPVTIKAEGVTDKRHDGEQYAFACEPGARIEMWM